MISTFVKFCRKKVKNKYEPLIFQWLVFFAQHGIRRKTAAVVFPGKMTMINVPNMKMTLCHLSNIHICRDLQHQYNNIAKTIADKAKCRLFAKIHE